MNTKLVKNALGRIVPTEINGIPQIPFMGISNYKPDGLKTTLPINSCADYPMDGNKVALSLKHALLRSGMG